MRNKWEVKVLLAICNMHLEKCCVKRGYMSRESEYPSKNGGNRFKSFFDALKSSLTAEKNDADPQKLMSPHGN